MPDMRTDEERMLALEYRSKAMVLDADNKSVESKGLSSLKANDDDDANTIESVPTEVRIPGRENSVNLFLFH